MVEVMSVQPKKRIEARDINAAVYKMGRAELVTAAATAKGPLRGQAQEELARREWNRLIKKEAKA